MAVLSPMPVNLQQLSPFRYMDVRIPEIRERRAEMVEERLVRVVDERIYVAVGKEASEGKQTLMWTLHNSGGKKICILHVHQPAQRIPMMGTSFSADQLEDHQVRFHREKEKQEMKKILKDYALICERAGVPADVLSIEMDSIEKGIVELISQHNIRRLVMGAAAAKSYSKKMLEPKSKKAIYVLLQAPVSCQVEFICKGNLVHTRKGRSQEVTPELAPLIDQETPTSEIGKSLKSQSTKETENLRLKLNNLGGDFQRAKSYIGPRRSSSTPSTSRGNSPQITPNSMRIYSGGDGGPIISPAYSCFSSCSSSDIVDDVASTSAVTAENGLELLPADFSNDVYQHASSPAVLPGRGLNEELYDQLQQAYADAESSKREAFEESMRRSRAEKDAIDAFRKAKILEALLAEEVRQRKEIEEALHRSKENIENMKQELEVVIGKLHISEGQKSSLENQIANSDRIVEELEQKMVSAVERLQRYKIERDEMEVERDGALKFAEEMREKQKEEASNTSAPQCLTEFSFSEIEEATDNFNLSMKIGEGGYGIIYKCFLRHTQVAVKVLHSNSSQGPAEFDQEVNILTKARHPNLVTLIGACPEACVLVYEFYPNGSLEDRLTCNDNTPPLTWQTRIRIATELCSALIFLHFFSPHSIVHGDLKPANILLDAHFVSKLSDFGISRILSENDSSSNNSTPFRLTEPKGTLIYVDPEFLQTGELTVQSDVYSFGVILLRLLTGRPALGVMKDVQCALEKGNLKELLDPTAGEWPFVQAKQLAHIAMRCCELNRRARPNLVTEVRRVLELMRISCAGASSSRIGSEGHYQTPPYFVCPIFQEIMEDPHVAADGFTYELEALKGWLDTGHDTSPMTNLKLPHHNLVPNRALRSAIQEWLQQP